MLLERLEVKENALVSGCNSICMVSYAATFTPHHYIIIIISRRSLMFHYVCSKDISVSQYNTSVLSPKPAVVQVN